MIGKKGKELDSNNICLDVRTTEEFNQGYIQGSINVDFYNSIDFMKFLEKSEKDNNYYVYCRSGKKAILLVKSWQKWVSRMYII